MENLGERVMSRRDFLKGSSTVVAGLSLLACNSFHHEEPTSTPESSPDSSNPGETNPFEDAKVSFSNSFQEARAELSQVPAKKDSYIQTAGETTLLNLFRRAAGNVIRSINPDYGREWTINTVKYLERSPLDLILNTSVMTPLL